MKFIKGVSHKILPSEISHKNSKALSPHSITLKQTLGLLNILSNVMYNYYDEVVPNIPSASKAGFAKKDVVVTGIIFDEHPYIAIAVANTGGNIGTNKQVIKLIDHMDAIMTEYEHYLNTKK